MKEKYIVREIPAEYTDFSWYFENDGLTEKGGDFCYNLFIIYNNHWQLSGFNIDRYKQIVEIASNLQDDFAAVGEIDYNGKPLTYKRIMEEYGIQYNPVKCHKLKEWAEQQTGRYYDSEDMIAEYLTIITGQKWETEEARGYCQGDYVKMVYCPAHYKNGVENYGEIYLGAGKEFCVIYLDENGEEIDRISGYIVADCEVNREEDYKKLVCEWAEIPEEETILQMVDDCITKREYSYRNV